jgi:hypothetical protein
MGKARTELDSSHAMMHFTTRLSFRPLRKLRVNSGRNLSGHWIRRKISHPFGMTDADVS